MQSTPALRTIENNGLGFLKTPDTANLVDLLAFIAARPKLVAKWIEENKDKDPSNFLGVNVRNLYCIAIITNVVKLANGCFQANADHFPDEIRKFPGFLIYLNETIKYCIDNAMATVPGIPEKVNYFAAINIYKGGSKDIVMKFHVDFGWVNIVISNDTTAVVIDGKVYKANPSKHGKCLLTIGNAFRITDKRPAIFHGVIPDPNAPGEWYKITLVVVIDPAGDMTLSNGQTITGM